MPGLPRSSSLGVVRTQRLRPSGGLLNKTEVRNECDICIYCADRVFGLQVGDSSLLRRGSSVGGAWLKELRASVREVGKTQASDQPFADCICDFCSGEGLVILSDPSFRASRGFLCPCTEHLNFLTNASNARHRTTFQTDWWLSPLSTGCFLEHRLGHRGWIRPGRKHRNE